MTEQFEKKYFFKKENQPLSCRRNGFVHRLTAVITGKEINRKRNKKLLTSFIYVSLTKPKHTDKSQIN